MFTKNPGIMYSITNSGQLLTSRKNFQVLMNPLATIYSKLICSSKLLLMESEKWRAICASVGDVLPWAARVARLCGWHASVGVVLAWVVCYYYCYCYY